MATPARSSTSLFGAHLNISAAPPTSADNVDDITDDPESPPRSDDEWSSYSPPSTRRSRHLDDASSEEDEAMPEWLTTALAERKRKADAVITENRERRKRARMVKREQSKAKGKAKPPRRKLRVKKVLKAKVAIWGDLPEWGDKPESPLLAMPGDVLNKCFVDQGLEVRDWIALAGVNKFFRHHLDDKFFHELWFLFGSESTHRSPFGYERKDQEYRIPGTLMCSTRDNRPKGHPASAPFTRTIKPWWVDPTIPPAPKRSSPAFTSDHPLEAEVKYYIPSGPRSKWTQEQYNIYKAEKKRYATRKRQKRLNRATEAAREAAVARERRTIEVCWKERDVWGEVYGRVDGQEAAKRGKKGMMAVEMREVRPKKTTPRRPAGVKHTAVDWWSSLRPGKEWEVPETDGEDDLESDRPTRYRYDGEVILDDYWPSHWRHVVAYEVNNTWISQTEALKTFRVSPAELITLRSTLVAIPPRKLPFRYDNNLHRYQSASLDKTGPRAQSMYLKAAVQALAYRSHGGYEAHMELVKRAEIRAKAFNTTKQAKRDRARAEGRRVRARAHTKERDDESPNYFPSWGREGECRRDCWCKHGGWQ